ncbi:trypsin-like peptidase domain-containing protein [Patulibacter brassicae]|jgi:S1-C subfamily serine protease|uniref:Trypsin-like peptidase domain-containing protein n=1 Tax=Patulibacter brassicae TaxID=1705717 RepID=A0ABU4VFN6_9ACTN|nr:trypsin-like peptidase domain-containing protein [Patulibacter brassicae]MDX8150609.1 trypsin-like peptidase domain-containing protein [Patulibacter brassicae]
MSKLATPAVVGVSAVLGAGLALGAGALGVGGDGSTTTVLRQAPIAQASNASSEEGAPTAREIYERDAPGVVLVEATVQQRSASQSLFGPAPQTQEGQSTGSGFVIDDEGYILTNEHVVEGATKVQVSFSNEKSASAEVVGKDNSNDIALLKVDPKGLDLKPLELGSAKDVQVGDPVLAIGNPFGLDRTLTTGVVSAKQRQITGPGGFSIDNVIQTDASINPGNSGGPLLDGAGKVIGINSQIATSGSGQGSVGIGFAVPIETVKQVLPDLKKDGHANIAYLGVTSLSASDFPDGLPEQLRPATKEGAIVQQVAPGSPAQKAGLRAGSATVNTSQGQLVIGGDVITQVDGKRITSADDVNQAITGKKPGDEVTVVVRRGSQEKKLKVTLGRRPDSTSSSADGSQNDQAPDEFQLP